MRKLFKAAIVLFFLFLLISCTGLGSDDDNNSYVSLYASDFKYLVNKLEKTHPNPYGDLTETEFHLLTDQIYEELRFAQKEYELVYKSYRFIEHLNDGHTGMELTPILRDPSLPINVKWFEDGLYIISTHKDYKHLLNKKIISIGGVDIYEVEKMVNNYMSGDNIYNKKMYNEMFIVKRSILEYIGLYDETEDAVSIGYSDGYDDWIEKVPTGLYFVKEVEDIGRNEVTKYIDDGGGWFKIIPEYSAVYFQLNTFIDKQALADYGYDVRNLKNFKQLYEALFTTLKENEIEYLVIDLRDNEGGAPELAFQFLSYIPNENYRNLSASYDVYRTYGTDDYEVYQEWYVDLPELSIFTEPGQTNFYMEYPEEELFYDGELFLITGNKTFSMASWFAALVQDNGYGKIIGEPTGVSSLSYGGITEIVLPRSRLYFWISTGMYKRTADKELNFDALYPDVIIPTSFEDYIHQRDPVWFYLTENVFGVGVK